MPKSKKRQNTKPAEPFAQVAERLGAALADVASHEDCPSDVYDAILQLDCAVFNHRPDVTISLRYSFPRRLVAALEQGA